jgi:hypothetical protein
MQAEQTTAHACIITRQHVGVPLPPCKPPLGDRQGLVRCGSQESKEVVHELLLFGKLLSRMYVGPSQSPSSLVPESRLAASFVFLKASSLTHGPRKLSPSAKCQQGSCIFKTRQASGCRLAGSRCQHPTPNPTPPWKETRRPSFCTCHANSSGEETDRMNSGGTTARPDDSMLNCVDMLGAPALDRLQLALQQWATSSF